MECGDVEQRPHREGAVGDCRGGCAERQRAIDAVRADSSRKQTGKRQQRRG